MPMYNLIEYSANYLKTSGSLWQYCKDIPAVDNNNAIVNFTENNLTGQTGDDGTKNVEIIVPLKYLSNFWLINSDSNLILACQASCVIISTNVSNQNATFEITDTKLFVPIITYQHKIILSCFSS